MGLKLLLLVLSLNAGAADLKYPDPKIPQIRNAQFNDAATNPVTMRAMVKAYGNAYIRAYIEEFTRINHVDNKFPRDLISQYNSQIDSIPDSAIMSYGKNTLSGNSGKAQMDLVARGLYEHSGSENGAVTNSGMNAAAVASGGNPALMASLMDRISQIDGQLAEAQKAQTEMQSRIRALEEGHPLPPSATNIPMPVQSGDWGKWVGVAALVFSLIALVRSNKKKKTDDKKSFKVY